MFRKKHLVTLLGISLCSNAFAISAPCVTIPNRCPGFGFSVTALALKPGATNLNYVIFNKELPTQSPSWEEKEIRPNYAPAFALSARYIFPEGKDITLDWTHLNTTSRAAIAAPSSSFFLGPDYMIGPTGLPIRNGSGKVRFKYDVVNLSAGQYVEFGRNVEVHFFGGLSTAFLREQVDSTYTGAIPTGPFAGPFSTLQETTANYYGIGPRFGIGATFNSECYGLGAFGESAVSALIGTSYAKTAFTSSAVELLALFGQTINNQYIKDQNVTQVIPAFDSKIGVSYTGCYAGTSFMVKAGYQAAVYVNAINQYQPASLVAGPLAPLTTGGIFVATMDHRLSNYSVQGPFVEASVQL